MLNDEQIRAAWQAYEKCRSGKVEGEEYIRSWHRRYLEFVTRIANLATDKLKTASVMRELWSARAVTTIGPGDSVPIDEFIDETSIVDAVATLQQTATWPADSNNRARAMQRAYNELEDLVRTRKTGKMPAARLKRLFAALLPRDLTTIVSTKPLRRVAHLLLDLKRGEHIELQVRIRSRLRSALGDEADLGDQIWRSMFCWWLHENHDELAAGRTPHGITVATPSDEGEPLDMWTGTKQYTSVLWFGGLSDTLREIVKEALDGTPRDDLVEALVGLDGRNLSPRGARVIIRRARSLGLLTEANGTITPTEDGEELLADEQGDIVVRRLLERYFGFAHLLRFVSEQKKGASTQDIHNHLRSLYPRWRKNIQANHIRSWCRDLDLISTTSNQHQITDYGKAWVKLLPKTLPTPLPPRNDNDDNDDNTVDSIDVPAKSTSDTTSADHRASPYPTYKSIRAKLDDPKQRFVIDDIQLHSLHIAWRCHPLKRFVILAGLSGTGKTAIVLQYTQAVCELAGLDPEDHRVVVAVSPDWRDPSGLLGYFNALHQDPTFHAEPALRLVQRAAGDPTRPYFLILDEMNLARVERYFAPFLSSMETGNPLEIHAHPEPVNDVEPRIPWPKNLYIAGTVNMDETTYAFSDKVLDRALTLEFWEVDLKAFFERWSGKREKNLENLLFALNEVLRPVRRHFGYRTAKEVLEFMGAIEGEPSEDRYTQLLDQVIFSRVLPRIRGDDDAELHTALEALKKLLDKHGLRKCSTKVVDMHKRLKRTGLTKFYA